MRPQESPISAFTGSVVKPRVGFTPILRAGLGMTDALLTLFPYVFFIAHWPPAHPRDCSPDSDKRQRRPRVSPRHFQGKSELAARRMSVPASAMVRPAPTVVFDTDYSKLPPSPPVDMIFLPDPLIATGGTATAALHMVTDWGIPCMDVPFRRLN